MSEAGEVSTMSEAEAHLTGARNPSDADISDSAVVLSGGSKAEMDASVSKAEQKASSSEEETDASMSEAEREASSSEEEVVFSDTSSEGEGTLSSVSSEEMLDTTSGRVSGFNLHQCKFDTCELQHQLDTLL